MGCNGTCIHPEPYSMDITVWFMPLDDEYSQSQAIHTPIQKGHAVLKLYLLTATTEKRREEDEQTI